MNEGWAVIIAAAMAIVGILYSARQQRKALRKQHTYQVLDKLNGWQKFDDDMEFARKVIKAKAISELCKNEDTAACERIDFLLNHYEFMAGAIISGDIDEALVRVVESDRMTRLYMKLIDYIEQNRATLGTDRIWGNLEFITHRWTVERLDLFDRTIESILLRPTMTSFETQRGDVRAAIAAHAKTIP